MGDFSFSTIKFNHALVIVVISTFGKGAFAVLGAKFCTELSLMSHFTFPLSSGYKDSSSSWKTKGYYLTSYNCFQDEPIDYFTL